MKMRPLEWNWRSKATSAVEIGALDPERPVVWAARLATHEDAQAQLKTVLSAEEHAQWARFRFEEDRQRYLVAHGLLRILAGAYLDVPAGRIAFGKGPFDKPFVLRQPEDHTIHFNLAHSGDLVLLAFSPTHEVGVDVERVDRALDWEGIAERMFSSAERHQLDVLEPDARRRAFFDGWTRTEACLKALGLGLSGDPKSITVPLASHPPATIETSQPGVSSPSRLLLYDLELPSGYAGAVAVNQS